jgi:hypothetical protein
MPSTELAAGLIGVLLCWAIIMLVAGLRRP